MTFPRRSGILLHPTSLPGPHGIGSLGRHAHQFIDFLADSDCHLWQVLPLGPTGYGDSPYQCFSAFAGNPYLISLESLVADGLLIQDDLNDLPAFHPAKVDYGTLIPWKLSILERAYRRFTSQSPGELSAALSKFSSEQAAWLDDYALFMAIKEAHGGGAWDGWPKPLRKRESVALKSARQKYAGQISRFAFYQFLFYRQWEQLRVHAHRRGIQIIGDIPIFVAYDSADVWSHPELFYLDQQDKPTLVAGVPPDLFSPTGQLWGNPLYKWEVHGKDGYAWWRDRLRATLKVVDIVRLDHFLGFARYWEITAGSPTAQNGRWVPGPGADLFDALVADLRQTNGQEGLPLIAEDLGVIHESVIELRERYNLPGMKIMQFGFSDPANPFLPHNYTSNYVTYTGTHDNDTARGWFESATEQERNFALRYLGIDGSKFSWDMVRATWASVAVFAIAPLQDLLDLGTEARMNYPSRLGGNWEWRMQGGELTDELVGKIRELNHLYSR